MDFNFKCPVCGELLIQNEKTLKCSAGHSFDISRQGYVNLLQSQKSSKKRHGDDGVMVKARQEFLDKGYYNCLADGILKVLDKVDLHDMTVADLGCGECWYTSEIIKYLENRGVQAKICGMDISKQALIAGSRRCKSVNLVVGSISDVPIPDNYCDIVTVIFAPHNEKEILRILKNGGIWINVIPLERHLMGLKSIIYDKPYENETDTVVPNGFRLFCSCDIRENIIIEDKNDIMNLFKMTPYYYKTGHDDQSKIEQIASLKTEIEFGIRAYSKI